MTNEQIHKEILEKMETLKNSFCCDNFVLNESVMSIKKKIANLQKECTHKDPNGNFALNAANRCPYCGCLINKE